MIQFFKKNFGKWFEVKPSVNNKKHDPPPVRVGDIWWYYCGENVGTEICGKGNVFLRPCIIYKKLSQYTFLIVPLSTKEKPEYWSIEIISSPKKSFACLHQITTIDYRRLKNFTGNITSRELKKIKKKFRSLYF